MLRSDLFTKLKMPLQLIYGQIGYLRIQIPWRSLSSKPVNVQINDIWLVVCKYTKFSRLTKVLHRAPD